MSHLLSDLAHGPEFRIHQDVGLSVGRLPEGEQALNPGHRVGIVEQGTMALMPDPLPDCVRGSPKAHHQGMGFQAGEIFRVGPEPAAGCEDGAFIACEVRDRLPFVLPEARFTILLKDPRDRFPGLSFNQFVCIEHLETEQAGYGLSNGAFARSHKSDQGDIADAPLFFHSTGLAQVGPGGTPFLPRKNFVSKVTDHG